MSAIKFWAEVLQADDEFSPQDFGYSEEEWKYLSNVDKQELARVWAEEQLNFGYVDL